MTEFHDLALLSLQPKTRGTRHGLRGAEYESCCEDQFHRGKANAFGAKRRDGGMIAGRWIEVADKVRQETEQESQALIGKPGEAGFCGADSSRARTKLRNLGQM